MVFLNMVLLILCFIIIRSIVLNLYRRKQLGNIKMKIKLGFLSYLLILFTVIACMVTAYFLIIIVKKFISSDSYGVKEIIWVILNSTLYTLIYSKIFISMITSREIREKGITFTQGVANYSGIKSIYWLNEKKVQINYDPKVEHAFNREFKEKWVVRYNQIDELKHFLDRKV